MSEKKPAINSTAISGALVTAISGWVISQGWFAPDVNEPINSVIGSGVELIFALGAALMAYGFRKSKGDISGIVRTK